VYVFLLLALTTSCDLLKSEDEDNAPHCTSEEHILKEYDLPWGLLSIYEYSMDGNYITIKYWYYVNSVCPSKEVWTVNDVELNTFQPYPVEVSFWISYGSGSDKRIEKNNVQGNVDKELNITTYRADVKFTPLNLAVFDDAATITSFVRFKFYSVNRNPDEDMRYLRNLYKRIFYGFIYYPY
jgi:hypothetical protein